MHQCRIIVLFVLCISAKLAAEVTVVSHNISAKHLVENPGYEAQLLMLSLEKTREEYGDFKIEPVRDDINHARKIEMLSRDRYTNFVSALPYSQSLEKDHGLAFTNFPVYLGILGYRTCFTSEKILENIASVENEDQLRNFSQGLVKGWADADILRFNGFRVVETTSYPSLFKMVAANRFDLFCRGGSEVLVEYKHYRDLKDFAYDRSMSIYYPLPHFFYAHKSAEKVLERVRKGLVMAHEDGSLYALWEIYYKDSIDFVGLDRRRVFKYKNPSLKGLSSEFENYVYSSKVPEK